MPTFIVSDISEPDKDVVIVFLPPEAAALNDESRSLLMESLRKGASEQGMTGDIIPVWEFDGGMDYIAEDKWSDFLENTSISELSKKMNGRITC